MQQLSDGSKKHVRFVYMKHIVQSVSKIFLETSIFWYVSCPDVADIVLNAVQAEPV